LGSDAGVDDEEVDYFDLQMLEAHCLADNGVV
jgi:hypothetical protein